MIIYQARRVVAFVPFNEGRVCWKTFAGRLYEAISKKWIHCLGIVFLFPVLTSIRIFFDGFYIFKWVVQDFNGPKSIDKISDKPFLKFLTIGFLSSFSKSESNLRAILLTTPNGKPGRKINM